MARLRDDGWHQIPDFPDGDLWVHLTPDLDVDGRQVITGVQITSARVTAAHLRAIPLGRIEIKCNIDPEPEVLPALDRKTVKDSVAFSDLVARHYRQCAATSNRPVRIMADRAGVPLATAHGWVREARLRGALPPGRRGRATV